MSSSSILGRLSLFILLSSGLDLGCGSAPPISQPVSFSFRPTRPGATLWLSTSIAIEVRSEHDARALEAEDPLYVGEVGVRGGRIRPAHVALFAAEHGATHFRVVNAGDDLRVEVILYRLERERWSRLPEGLRPAPPVQPMVPAPDAQALVMGAVQGSVSE